MQSPALFKTLRRMLSPLRVQTRARPSNTFSIARRDQVTLYRDCKAQMWHEEEGPVVLQFLAALNRAAVDATRYFSVHAAVLGKGRRVVAVAGDSGSGKSTLAAALAIRGWRYGSDESLSFDDDGDVVPYAKPVTLNPWSWKELNLKPGDDFVSQVEAPFGIDELQGSPLENGMKLTDLVIPHITAGPPAIEALSPSEAVKTLLQLSFNHYRDGTQAFQVSTRVAATAQAWRLQMGSPLATAAFLDDVLAG